MHPASVEMIHRILDGDMKPVKEASSVIGCEMQVQIELHPNIDRKLRKTLALCCSLPAHNGGMYDRLSQPTDRLCYSSN
jgi:hypothetical protein